jgi:hypothetical protein
MAKISRRISKEREVFPLRIETIIEYSVNLVRTHATVLLPGLSKTALRNLPEKALSSENLQFIDTVDDSLRSIAN